MMVKELNYPLLRLFAERGANLSVSAIPYRTLQVALDKFHPETHKYLRSTSQNDHREQIRYLLQNGIVAVKAKEVEAERLRVAEAERLRVAEAERLRVAEAERLRVAEAERLRVAEAERLRVAEAERLRVAEAERLRVAEAERLRVAEAERLRVAEADIELSDDDDYSDCSDAETDVECDRRKAIIEGGRYIEIALSAVEMFNHELDDDARKSVTNTISIALNKAKHILPTDVTERILQQLSPEYRRYLSKL
jgi:hypothetical protein